MLRAAAVGVPTWVVLLAALPATGLGVGACLALATLGAVVAIVLAGRMRGGRARTEGDADAPRPRRAIGPLAAVALTLGAVALLAYVVFVIRAA